ncbi:hypothetical protein GWO43_12810 [candidate division KSB1 bacterium]|nr:hypothetical protein [candidate division KSB1 bacterium]NIR71305.1 hypothetical protein [candidate division KSB1 bacterium]NIS24533.1 hypothetical protein [candidate division KSB1 bacterium]NIT71740.1 hypothetical protein [candidate division KSB1 bacterium]NIU25142.1 hypothetical protein [candidate division KSB1 bacterium]
MPTHATVDPPAQLAGVRRLILDRVASDLPSFTIAVVCLMNKRENDSGWYGRPFTTRITASTVGTLCAQLSRRSHALYERLRPALDYETTESLLGHWEGTVRSYMGETTAVTMWFQSYGDIHVTIGDQYTTLVQNPRGEPGCVLARVRRWLPTEATYEHDHYIFSHVRFSGKEACGYLNANFESERGVYELPSYLRLKRSD